MVPFGMMRRFQDLGHTGVLIIGDFTARIGDPTERITERKRLTAEEVAKNGETYAQQIFRVVDRSRTETVRQSEWYRHFNFVDVIELAANFSVAHLLSHETYRNRLAPGFRLSLHELLYPTLQAYDSVQVQADVELGGMDQKFNILCGRDLMRANGLEPQVAVLLPLLSGTDGRKMSKSLGNHIPVELSADDKIGRIMSIDDELMLQYATLAAGMTAPEAKEYIGEDANPRDTKLKLAARIARRYHTQKEVDAAVLGFERVFTEKLPPGEMDSIVIGKEGVGIIALITDSGLAPSNSEARRLIGQGAVTVDGKRIDDIYHLVIPDPDRRIVVKVGKRRFLSIVTG
jgi:tyrosyl-tRNA synthetase